MTNEANLPSTPMMRVLAGAIKANVPVLIWGNPGVTKTASIEAHCAEWGYHSEVVVGGCREAVDFMGLPVEHDGEVVYSKLGWFKRLEETGPSVLILDEFSSIAPSTARAMVRIVQERWVGDHRLPDTCSIIAIANPPETAVDGWDLAPPVANRFFHLDWHFDKTSWLQNVVSDFISFEAPSLDEMTGTNSIANMVKARSKVTAFLQMRPNLLDPTPPSDPTLAGKAWPSPRSWTNAMAILGALAPGDESAARLALIGCVGEGAANEFMVWEVAAGLHDPEEVLRDPSIVDWKGERPDRLFALVNAVTAISHLRVAEGQRAADAWTAGMKVLCACAEGGRPDAAMPGARSLLNEQPSGAKLTAEMRRSFVDILTRMGRLAPAA